MKQIATSILPVLVFVMLACFPHATFCAESITASHVHQAGLSSELRQRAIDTLRDGLSREEGFVKVHAAEFLLELSYPQQVYETFLQEQKLHGQQMAYRIGIWRVLARSAIQPAAKEQYVHKIIEAAANAEGSDRVFAVESLAKLGVAVDHATASAIAAWANEASDAEAAFAWWVLSLSPASQASPGKYEQKLAQILQSHDPLARLRAAYTLSKFENLSENSLQAIQTAVVVALERETSDAIVKLADTYALLLALKVTRQTADATAVNLSHNAIEAQLQQRAHASTACAKVYANALADLGSLNQIGFVQTWLDHEDSDLRLSVAHALLRMERRRSAGMAGLDWAVIAVYFIGMLAVGLYYARQTKSTDDYLLGGRHMNPWMVGLSLFATLLSTLTYLAIPGEMIRHGPIIIVGVASFPLVSWVVGWKIIPLFMKLNLTSAYEVLESRFGYSGRLLGSLIFLLLRFFWMAVILYATTDKVIVPLLNWPSTTTPWICAVLGLITVIYSAMGGLRAVVLTDVIQTGILVGGAILTLIVITVSMGGITPWWPSQWDANWTPFRFFELGADRTVLMALVGMGLWYICTAGSDQMAIQRYLATRDIKAARRMFNITLGMNLLGFVLLSCLGFALLGFYRTNPQWLGDGMTLTSHADKLFPRFIVFGLPAGVSGLVVAGLLAAAMSSLSSGINSSCAVISIDFLGRWRKKVGAGKTQLLETQLISVGIGVVAVLLSMAAGKVQGNLLDVVYKIGNLLVVPLFILFFMALFVKRCRRWATFLAFACSVTAAVLVAYGDVMAMAIPVGMPGAASIFFALQTMGKLGVLWIMPLSMVIGVVVGVVASWIPLGKLAPGLAVTE